MISKIFLKLFPAVIIVLIFACSPSNKKSSVNMKIGDINFEKGTYGYDLKFLTENKIETIQLTDSASGACVMVSPGLQGRVMTSTAKGYAGSSYGWINFEYIRKGQFNTKFNPFGGEERFWLGPEGGPFSIYFDKGSNQDFASWRVPKEIDTEAFEVTGKSDSEVSLNRIFSLKNAMGNEMQVSINRKVKLITRIDSEKLIGLKLPDSLQFVAFETENKLTNSGTEGWDSQNGFLSIWLLCMFNPSEEGVVFIPFKPGDVESMGKKVTDDYFGKVPANRLVVKEDRLFFKTDGKLRSKIGISPERALPWCGSYDSKNKLLTLLWYSAPAVPEKYVNSKWGKQDDPLKGDVVNSYNDGPADDGTIMGPFYEIESSSPAALLKSGESITHTQRIFHISGNEVYLNDITKKLFNLDLREIKSAFIN